MDIYITPSFEMVEIGHHLAKPRHKGDGRLVKLIKTMAVSVAFILIVVATG